MRTCLLLLSVILFFSCSPDSPDDPEPILSGSNLLKSEKKYAYGTLEMESTFYYNSNGNISKIDVNSIYQGTGSYEYFYDDNGRMESYTLSLLNPSGDKREEHTTLIYEGNNIVRGCANVVLTKEDGSPEMDPTVDKEEFEYNLRDLVTKAIKFDHGFQETETCESLEYVESFRTMEYDSKGNLSRLENIGDLIFGSTYLTYTFDDTFSPYRNLKPVYFRNFYNYSSENNVLAAEEFDSNSNEKVGYVEYNYEFNEENYPILVNRKWSTVDDSVYQPSTYEYTYY